MTYSSMTAYGRLSSGRRSPQRSGAAPGSTRGILTVASFLTLRSLVKSWRFVSLSNENGPKIKCDTFAFASSVNLLFWHSVNEKIPTHVASLTPDRV